MDVGRIYPALLGVLADLPAIGKDSRNQQQGYQYRGLETITGILKPLLVKHQVAVVPTVLESRHELRAASGDKQMPMTYLRVRFAFTSLEDGSTVEAVTEGEGSDYGDKGSNKAMSAAFKYALVQTLCIADFDDSDAESPEHETHKQSHRPAMVPSGDDFGAWLNSDSPLSTMPADDGLERVTAYMDRIHKASRDDLKAIMAEAQSVVSPEAYAKLNEAATARWRLTGTAPAGCTEETRKLLLSLAQSTASLSKTGTEIWLPNSQFAKVGHVSDAKRDRVPLATICATEERAHEVVGYLGWLKKKNAEKEAA